MVSEQSRTVLRPRQIPSITLRRITKLKPKPSEDGDFSWDIESREVTYTFPGKTKDEARRFACLIRILSEIKAVILQDAIVTKRDIFYRDPELFVKQDTVDRFIEDIAYTCGVSRADLHVIASPRGLIVGLKELSEAETIPLSIANRSLDHIRWILVVEKEATFQSLLDQQLHQSDRIGPGLVVTAKGYPDLATLRFLRIVLDHPSCSAPIFGLFDFDPYGVEILRCYKAGSKVLHGDPEIRIPEMKLLGVKLEHLAASDAGALPLTSQDESRSIGILSAMTLEKGAVVPGLEDCRVELQRMLMARKKAEIQAIDSQSLVPWLEDEIRAEVPTSRWM